MPKNKELIKEEVCLEVPAKNMGEMEQAGVDGMNNIPGKITSLIAGIDIGEIEERLLKEDQAPCPVVHSFGPGLYIREVHLPKGAFCIGHRQKEQHLNIMLKGEILIFKSDGVREKMTAPAMFTGEPGRKMGYVVEDVVWLNIYPTSETSVDVLEATYLEKSGVWNNIPQVSHCEDVVDYLDVLEEMKLTEVDVRKQVENEDDQIPMPFGSFKVGVFKSKIEGRGIFATSDIEPGEFIAPARIDDKRTPVGRFANHSKRPNAKMIIKNNDILLVASKQIKGCLGGALGDEITTDYRENIVTARGLICHQ